MKLLSTLIVAGATLAAIAPAAEACNGNSCRTLTTPAKYETRTERVRVPGQWTFEMQNVTTPGRWEVTYQTVRAPGRYEVRNERVWVPGKWVRHDRRPRKGRAHVQVGRHFSVSFKAPRPRKTFVPGHWKVVQKRVFVPGCVTKKPVRTWIPACTTQKRVRVWKPACFETRQVKVFVPAKTVSLCQPLHRPRHRRPIRKSRPAPVRTCDTNTNVVVRTPRGVVRFGR